MAGSHGFDLRHSRAIGKLKISCNRTLPVKRLHQSRNALLKHAQVLGDYVCSQLSHMKTPHPMLIGLATLLCGLAGGCIQEDPQAEALRNRLDSNELELSKLRKQIEGAQQPAASSGDMAKNSTTASRIRELEAQVEQLIAENAQWKQASLKAPSSGDSDGMLSHSQLLGRLEEASLPLRKQIKSLYEIEQASLRELTINQNPYSCVIRLDLKNLATGAKEQVEVPASANIRGEWKFPPVERIAETIRSVPEPGTVPAPILPSPQFAPAHPLQPGAPDPMRAPRVVEAAPSPPRPSTPSSVPVPGELAGEMKLNW